MPEGETKAPAAILAESQEVQVSVSISEEQESGAFAKPAEASSGFVLAGQICVGLALALVARDIQLLVPWGPDGNALLATGLGLAGMILMFQSITELIDDAREQAPELWAKLRRVVGPMVLGGGLTLALVSLAGEVDRTIVAASDLRQAVQQWSNRIGLNAQPNGPNGSDHFSYTLTLGSGFPVTVRRSRDREGFLTFSSTLRLSSQHRTAFQSLPWDQQMRAKETLGADLAGQGVDFRPDLPNAIYLESSAPIGSLSQAAFRQRVADMDAALGLARDAVVKQVGGR